MLNQEACRAVVENLLESPRTLAELHDEGFGKEIYKTLEDRGYYQASELIKWEYVTRNNLEAINVLVSEFGETLLIEQIYPRYRYSVQKQDKSIGHFFGLLEKVRDKLALDEYSASQTTLEQIFNGFARSEDHEAVQRRFND